MNGKKFQGLLTGLLVALVTVGIVAGGAVAAPHTNPGPVSANPAPTALIAALPAATSPLTAGMALPGREPSATITPAVTQRPTQPQASFTPSPTSRPTQLQPSPTPSPAPTGTPVAGVEQVIGYSVQGRPLTAHRFGQGPIKTVLVADIHGEFEANTYELAQQLLAHFLGHPGDVPEQISLWILPSMNPDGLVTGHRWNANDVDLNRNADTDLDGCAGNDWSPDTVGLEGPHPGAGGPYPFSEPEAVAVRDFLDDAQIAIFYHSAAEAIFVDSCQRYVPTARLAEVLSSSTGYPIPEDGWAGYPITGDFADYLASEGVAAVTLELTNHEDPEFERNLAGVQAVLAAAGEILGAEATAVGADHTWLDESNTGAWHYADNSFIHPLALELVGQTAYLLDGGRVLALDLARPTAPTLLLAPGDYVENVRVLEPLDLAVVGAAADGILLALDRAGDVYGYDPATGAWSLERYDRPSGATSDHYFVALAAAEEAAYLLETTHEQAWRFAGGQRGAPWAKLPQGRDVDVAVGPHGLYALTRAMNSPTANLLRFQDGRRVSEFQPNVDLTHPRQVLATAASVYVLDRAGRRLVALDPESGKLQALYQFPDRRDVSAIWANLGDEGTPSGTRLILAGRNVLYFLGEPDRAAQIEGGPLLEGPQPHDLALLEELRGFSIPIEGATVTKRDFQMPGAPRHYRLGVHEGIDFYSNTVGVPVDRRTPVRAVADGVVIRALVDYQPLTAAQADSWYATSLELGYTPPEVLDGYRGRQVWIDHGGGIVSRYAHLGSIADGIVEGAQVVRGQVIATVGNSGTPASLTSQTVEVHLHLELWVGEHFAGQFLRPIEAREWLERILR